MSEDCCRDTSAAKYLYICCLAIGQEAESDRVTRVIVRIQLLTIVGTEWSDRRGFMRRMCFSLFKLWKCIRGKSSYCSWSEN